MSSRGVKRDSLKHSYFGGNVKLSTIKYSKYDLGSEIKIILLNVPWKESYYGIKLTCRAIHLVSSEERCREHSMTSKVQRLVD